LDHKRSHRYSNTAYYRIHSYLSSLESSNLKSPQACRFIVVHAKPLVHHFFYLNESKLIYIRTVPLVIFRLINFQKSHRSSTTTDNSFNFALVTVIHTNFSVIASCTTFLKPMVDSLHIGLMKNDIQVPTESDDMAVGGKRNNPFPNFSKSKPKHTHDIHRPTWNPRLGGISASTATTGTDPDFQLQDLERHGSQDRMLIKQTKTTDVSSYPRNAQKASSTRLPSKASAGDSQDENIDIAFMSHLQ